MPKLVAPPAPQLPIRNLLTAKRRPATSSRTVPCQFFVSSPVRPLAHPQHGILHEPWQVPLGTPLRFSPSGRNRSISDELEGTGYDGERKPPDERVLKLGKTLRTLSPLLPTLLFNPLPTEILSPHVTLHLFPSTHPHLPTVKGRTLYRAALWTVPVAWSALPLVGNVRLQIMSERIVRAGTVLDPEERSDSTSKDGSDERLVVRWKTEPRNEDTQSPPPTTDTNHPSRVASSSSKPGINRNLSVLLGGDSPIFKLSKEEQFTGLFIFSFDEEGRIASHTIEHADDARGWERTAKFVTLTDWLIGKARGSLDPGVPSPGLAMQGCEPSESFSWSMAREDFYHRR